MTECNSICDAAYSFGSWLYNWQTLITGVLALVVGAASIGMIKRQIAQQDKQHASGRRSRFAVAKAKSPFAAIELADHAKVYLVAAEQLLPLVTSRARQPFEFAGPEFPPRAEAILDTLVETADDSVIVDQVSALYSEHQVMSSRLSFVRRPSEHTLTIDDYILQPLMMDAIAMNLLAFGRDDVPMSNLSWEDVEGSAKRLITDSDVRVRILNYISDRKARERPVPLALRRHSG